MKKSSEILGFVFRALIAGGDVQPRSILDQPAEAPATAPPEQPAQPAPPAEPSAPLAQ